MDKFFYCYNAKCQKVNSTSVFSFDPFFLAIKDLMLSELRQIVFYINKIKDFNVDMSLYRDKVIEFIAVLIVNLDFHRESFFVIAEDLYKNKLQIQELYSKLCDENNTKPEHIYKSNYELNGKHSVLQALNDIEKNMNKDEISFSKQRKNLYDIMLNLVLNACNSLIELKNYGVDLPDEKDEVLNLLNTTNLTDLTDDEWIEKINDFAKTNYTITKILNDKIVEKFGPIQKSTVPRNIKKGKCILVSGGSFADLEKILTESKNDNINVYVSDEMMSAFSFEKLSAKTNLTGCYSSDKEGELFNSFPGPIFISGSIINEVDAIRGQIYTDAKYPPLGIGKISDNDFSPLIDYAKKMSGFSDEKERSSVDIGYSQSEIEGLIDELSQKINENEIKNIIIFSPCENEEHIKNYVNEFMSIPQKDNYIISFSYKFSRKNFKYFNTNYDFTLAYQLVSKLKELNLNSRISVFLFDLKTSVISTVFNFKYLGVKNIFIAHCCKNSINQDLSNGLSEMFNIKEISNAKDDFKYI